MAAALPALPEDEPVSHSPPRKTRRLPASSTVSPDNSSGDEGMADSEQSLKQVRKPPSEAQKVRGPERLRDIDPQLSIGNAPPKAQACSLIR